MTRDGKFIGVIDADQTQTGTTFSSQLQVVLNWFTDVQQRVPAK